MSDRDEHLIAIHLDGPQSPGTSLLIVIRHREVVQLATDSGSGPRDVSGYCLEMLNRALGEAFGR